MFPAILFKVDPNVKEVIFTAENVTAPAILTTLGNVQTVRTGAVTEINPVAVAKTGRVKVVTKLKLRVIAPHVTNAGKLNVVSIGRVNVKTPHRFSSGMLSVVQTFSVHTAEKIAVMAGRLKVGRLPAVTIRAPSDRLYKGKLNEVQAGMVNVTAPFVYSKPGKARVTIVPTLSIIDTQYASIGAVIVVRAVTAKFRV